MIAQLYNKQESNAQPEKDADKIIAVYTQQLAVYTRHLRNATWFLVAVTVLIALIGAITTIITWNALDDQQGFSRKQIDRMDSQVKIARESMRRDLRAYVYVTGFIPPSLPYLPLSDYTVLPIVNAGKTPANRLLVYWHDTVREVPLDLRKGDIIRYLPRDTNVGPSSLIPGEPMYLPISRDSVRLALRDVQRSRGKRAIYLYGEADYFDVFNQADTTRFSYWIDTKGVMQITKTGNDAK